MTDKPVIYVANVDESSVAAGGNQFVDQLRDLGLQPRRVRITCLQPHCKSLVHKDAETTDYMARIHIPLWTNEKCVHICQGEHLHMPADGGAYIMWVNLWHQIRNDSDEPRYHIIMDAYDTRKITKNFGYNANIQELIDFHKSIRKEIDAAVISPEEFEKFEAVRQTFVTKPKK